MKAICSIVLFQDPLVAAFLHTAPHSSRHGLEIPDGHYQAWCLLWITFEDWDLNLVIIGRNRLCPS